MSDRLRPWWVIMAMHLCAGLLAGLVAVLVVGPLAFYTSHLLLDPLEQSHGGHNHVTSALAVSATLVGLAFIVGLPALVALQHQGEVLLQISPGWPRRRARLIAAIAISIAGCFLVRQGAHPALIYLGAGATFFCPWLSRQALGLGTTIVTYGQAGSRAWSSIRRFLKPHG